MEIYFQEWSSFLIFSAIPELARYKSIPCAISSLQLWLNLKNSGWHEFRAMCGFCFGLDKLQGTDGRDGSTSATLVRTVQAEVCA